MSTVKKGTLVVVGTGIESLGQMTPAARSELGRAQRVFFLAADALTEQAIRSLHPKAVTLRGHYAVGKHRLATYAQMVETILAEVRRGRRVCLALYGHPGVFALPAHAAVTMARSEGYRATMLPGISADACLIADLGVDPASNGWQSFEATDFLVRRRRADPTSGLVLWQIGVVGRLDYPSGDVHREKLEILTEALLEQYPRRHIVTLYEASALPGFPPSIEKVELGSLSRAAVTSVTTMYVPPAKRAKVDRKMMARLGITEADSIHCLRTPGAASVAKS
jgi:precorrin-3B methylase